MQGSKIRLSPSELALFCNAEIILTKNSILQNTVALLAEVQEQIFTEGKNRNLLSTPKISRGENYLGLPYVVLDYPRIAEGDDLFFVRSMFWWGRFYSSTLQLSGKYKESSINRIVSSHGMLTAQSFYAGIEKDPWQHHFEDTNYQQISSLNQEAFRHLLQQQPHIKIAAHWPLSEWEMAANRLANSWKMLVALVA